MEKQNNLTIPVAIIVAGVLIAGAVFLTNDKSTNTVADNKEEPTKVAEIALAPITEDDHLLGNPNASIIIVEYSDTECPYCKTFHPTMERIIDEYGKDGQVAWVYRHFPLDSIHPKADKEAEATECAAELGGNSAFWAYLSKIFEITPSNNNLDLALLPDIATEIGLDKAKFEECLASGRWAQKVEDQYQSGVAAGVRGTPHSIIVTTKDGAKYPLSGAQPYQTVKQIIDAGLADQAKQ